ncbi:MAPEG family protein [Rugamonas aquatica]|uniref:Glutathione metabolism protein n=1 Tax=Rugamonas aquatica TaxID=2743357 RepID=A0A6A7N5I4_9BURK|nr:MAPEG family protein [Rugamonas aquatica]MQA40138.1 glutathione metabolism protein [Rugamonas aquatica]
MTIANWCVLAACMLPTATVGLAKLASAKLARGAGRYDNKQPREWAAGLTGWQARANAAQMNGFEILPLFIAAVVLAQQAHGDQGRIDTLALGFIGLRLVYIALYLANVDTLRTLVWLAGVGVSIALLAMG